MLDCPYFKSVDYRKLAKIRKSMQICMPFVPKKFKKILTNYFYEMTLPQTGFFQFPIFDTN